jgi:hypothetical protein
LAPDQTGVLHSTFVSVSLPNERAVPRVSNCKGINAVAEHRHKRETNARRFPRAVLVAAPLAGLATLSAVAVGVLTASPEVDLPTGAVLASAADSVEERAPLVSRRAERRSTEQLMKAQQRAYDRRLAHQDKLATADAVAAALKEKNRLWTTAPLDLWSSPEADAENLGELEEGSALLATGRKAKGRVEVVVDGKARWVTAGYLSEDKPLGVGAGLSNQPCPDSSVENGLTSNAVLVYRSVCNAFPQITSYGGWDGHGEHASGRALDIMTSDVALGTAIADFLRSHSAELKLYDVIWRQRIWTPVRGGEGWRGMSSRGSATANHYDHVHVSTY